MEVYLKRIICVFKNSRTLKETVRANLCRVLFLPIGFMLFPDAVAQAAPPPMITGILPANGLTNGGTIVSITGTGFQPGAAVVFGAIPALSVSVNGDTGITAVTPPAFVGAVDVTISNSDGQIGTLSQGFFYSIQPIYNWTTIAGVAATGAVDGTNNSARFASPNAVAQDSAGNIYVVNNGNNTIRKLTPVGTNWVSRTIAGTAGVAGSVDGTNTAALFSYPNGIAVDAQTNLYITEYKNNTVRKLTPVGSDWVSSTIAGLAGTSGSANGTNNGIRFWGPSGIAVDPLGNVYVADEINNVIRELTPVGTNWVSSTIADIVTSPIGITFGGGNLFVTSFNRIDLLTPSGTNWVRSTLAGQSISGSADGTNNSALFWAPYGIAVDANTNLYVADTGNSTTRLLTLQGTNWVSSTIAGIAGMIGSTDGTNTAALFFQPQGITVANNGSLLIADTVNNTVRNLQLSGTNWISSTIAGQAGSVGGADGTNNVSLFADPSGIAVDNAGNVYVASTGYETIRKIVPSGGSWVSTTIAGQSMVAGNGGANGTNTAALFYNPEGLAVDQTGNVYIADANNGVMRKLTLSGTNYVSSTLPGLPYPGYPQGVAIDNRGDVFIADSANSAIGELASGNQYKGLAGGAGYLTGTNDGAGGTNVLFKQPAGLALDGRTNLYVADTGNNTIRRLVSSNGTWISSTISGLPGVAGNSDGTNNNALFRGPQEIAVDAQTNLYIADTGNSLIRKLTPIGTNWVSSTIGGIPGGYGSADGTNSNARFANPGAIAVDTNGNVYVADSRNNTVRMAAFTTGVKLTPSVTWSNPSPFYYGALTTNQLNAFASVPGSFTYSPPPGTIPSVGTDTLSLVFTPNDSVDYNAVTDTVSVIVLPFAPAITLTGSNVPGILGGTTSLSASVSGPGPFLYQWVLNGSNLINNTITTVAGSGLAPFSGDGAAAIKAGMNSPSNVAVDPSGNLYIPDTGNNRIRKVDTNGIITTVAGNGTNGFAGDGNAATKAELSSPLGLSLDPLGNLFFADSANEFIRKVDTNGIITTVAGTRGHGLGFSGDGGPATNAVLHSPTFVAADKFGNLFIADSGGARVRKVGTNGIINTVAGKGTTPYSGDGGPATNAGVAPVAVAVDGFGNLFIADAANNRIRKVNSNGIITTVAGNGSPAFAGDGGPATNASLSAPGGVGADGFGNLFIADTSNGRIRRVDTNGIITTVAGGAVTGFSGDGGAATNAELSSPGGATPDAFGNFYIADTTNNRIRKVFTSPTLTLTNLATNSAGTYQLVVTSPYGSTTSTVALSVGLPPLQAKLNAGNVLKLHSTGTAGSNYVLQAATNLNPPVLWIPVATNVADTNGNWSFTDTNTAAFSNRYYRVTGP